MTKEAYLSSLVPRMYKSEFDDTAAFPQAATHSLKVLMRRKLTMKTTSMDVRIGSLPVCILTKASPEPRKKSDLRCFR